MRELLLDVLDVLLDILGVLLDVVLDVERVERFEMVYGSAQSLPLYVWSSK